MSKRILIFAMVALLSLNLAQLLYCSYAHRLTGDVVPDEETAIAVGSAILLATHRDFICEEEPFGVSYNKRKNAWVVHSGWPDNPNLVGTVVAVLIRKSDGKVLGFEFA